MGLKTTALLFILLVGAVTAGDPPAGGEGGGAAEENQSPDPHVAPESAYAVNPGGANLDPEMDLIKMKKFPQSGDPDIQLRNQTMHKMETEWSATVVKEHTYDTVLEDLMAAVDIAENKIKALRLRMVQKQNFLDSVILRQNLVTADVKKDKIAAANMDSHIRAIRARIERIKQQKELDKLTGKFHEYAQASDTLVGEAVDLKNAKSALYSKMKITNDAIQPLRVKEDRMFRQSLGADPIDPALVKAYGPKAGAAAGASGPAAGAAPAAAKKR